MTMVCIALAMRTNQPDHSDNEWKLMDEGEMDPSQLKPKPPLVHTSELTPLLKDTQTRGDSGTKTLTNEEGWEVVYHVKPTITDRKLNTLKEIKDGTNQPR